MNQEEIRYVPQSEIVKLNMLDTDYAGRIEDCGLVDFEYSVDTHSEIYICAQVERFNQNPTKAQQFDSLYRITTQAEDLSPLSFFELNNASVDRQFSPEQVLRVNDWLEQLPGVLARLELPENVQAREIRNHMTFGFDEATATEVVRIQNKPLENHTKLDEAKLDLIAFEFQQIVSGDSLEPLPQKETAYYQGLECQVEFSSYSSERAKIQLWAGEELVKVVSVDSDRFGYLTPSMCIVKDTGGILQQLLEAEMLSYPVEVEENLYLCKINKNLIDE